MKGAARTEAGITRIEVIALIAAVLALLATGLLVGKKVGRSRDLSQCEASLKAISLGLNLWLQDNERYWFPWQIAKAERKPQSFPESLRTNCWFQFMQFSNQLGSPKVLVDPADHRRGLKVATSWAADLPGGFAHPNYQNDACSYGLGIDIGLVSLGRLLPLNEVYNPILAIDRNLGNLSKSGTCYWELGTPPTFRKSAPVFWTDELHGSSGGQVALMDGSVDTLNAWLLNKRLIMNTEPSDFEVGHFLFPFLRE